MPITNGTGQFEATLAPIPIRLVVDNGDVLLATEVEGLPGFIGAYAMLMEEDATPEDAIQAVLETVAEGIQDILDDLLSQIDLSQLTMDEKAFFERSKELEAAAILAARQQMNLWELIWGGAFDHDDPLIQKLALANVLQLDLADAEPGPGTPTHRERREQVLEQQAVFRLRGLGERVNQAGPVLDPARRLARLGGRHGTARGAGHPPATSWSLAPSGRRQPIRSA